MQIEFPDASIMYITERTWKMFFDGSHTQNGARVGVLFVSPHGYTIPKYYKLLFPCTNNIAEYEALTNGIKMALEWRITKLHIYGDSQLVVNQVNNEYQTKDDKLIPYKKLIDSLRNYFTFVTFQQIPRAENKAADAMATLASILQLQEHESRFEFLVEELRHPAYDSSDNQVICTVVGHDSSRYAPIFSYLRDQVIPETLTRNQKRQLLRNASHYTLVSGDLYRKGLDGTLLRCLELEESEKALAEVHDGICGAHSNGLALARKLLRTGYYWPTMQADAVRYARSCQKCQLHGNLIHAPGRELIPSVTYWPFQQWAFDLVGKIHPSSSSGHKFIITATEYFTKWVEAVPLSAATGKHVALFILNHIICRYGIPSSIVTDNGGQFKNKDLKQLCKKFRIKQHWSSIYYPQGNGQAEASNKTLLKILHRTVHKSGRDWHLQINPALWAYRTTIRTPTGATPFSLVYGSEAVLPLEVEIPSLRVSLHGLITDEDHRAMRVHELETLDERRKVAFDHMRAYQKRMSTQYNKKVHPREFQVGELVLRENPKNQQHREQKGKFEPNWLGPYIITAVFGSGAYQLSTSEGEELAEPINILHLKKFYA